MKKILGIITALGLVSLPVTMVISCQTEKQENEKRTLEKLIDKVDKSVSDEANPNKNDKFYELQTSLKKAKKINLASESKEKDYIDQFDSLQEAYWAWQANRPIKEDLKKLIQTAQGVLLSNEKPKPEELTLNLKKSIEEAMKIFEVRSIDVEAVDLVIVFTNLQYHLNEFTTWPKRSNSNLNYAANILDYQPPLNKLVI